MGGRLLRDPLELFLHRLWKAHADEILTWEEVIFAGFIDNAYQSVFRRELVVQHGVELSKFERGRIVLIADADSEVLELGLRRIVLWIAKEMLVEALRVV